MNNENLIRGFRLGELWIAPRERTITRPDGIRHLPPKAVDVLLCLAARPGELFTRDELLSQVWGAGRGSHEGLNHAISDLRHALGDDPDRPVFIETVPRRGYRLLGRPQAAPPPAAPKRRAGDRSLFHELKRRGVVETGIAYLVLGWLVIQVADVTFDQLLLPQGWGTFVTVLVIAGFPVALLLAWFLEVVGGRITVDHERDARPALTLFSRTSLAVVGALTLASAGVYVYDQAVGLPTEQGHAAVAATVRESATPIEPNSIAVLRFLNIGGSEETDIFSSGLAEDVMSRLEKVPALHVSARGDSFSLPPNASSEDVRKRLRVRFYLEGSVRLADRTLRVVIHLIDSEKRFRVFSRTFNRDRTEFFEIQDEITNLTVASLRVVLPPETQTVNVMSGDTPDLDAYILYRRGMNVLYRPLTPASIDEALDWFGRSLEIDPEFAAAYAGICATYAQGFTVTNDPSFITKAEESCAAAIDRNPNLDVVHDALGDLYAKTGRDREAESAFKEALEINVNNVQALTGLADIYYREQRLRDAEEMYRKAIGLQPGDWTTYNALGWFLFQNGRYAEATEQYRKIISFDSTNVRGYENLGSALMLSGNFEEAAAAFLRAVEIQPGRDAYSSLGLLYYYLGDADQAVTAHRKAIELTPNEHWLWANLGDALSFNGSKKAARDAFVKAEALAESRLEINPVDAGTLIDLSWIKAMLGKTDEGRRLISRARDITPGDPYLHFYSALISVRLGERTAVYEELQTAVDLGYPLELLTAEPHLRSIRHESRFKALARQQVVDSEPAAKARPE